MILNVLTLLLSRIHVLRTEKYYYLNVDPSPIGRLGEYNVRGIGSLVLSSTLIKSRYRPVVLTSHGE